MSDPYVTRQDPTDDSLISNGDPDMALHYVDRLDAGIDSASKEEVIDALRFWVGEADYYKNTRDESSLIDDIQHFIGHIVHESKQNENQQVRLNLAFVADNLRQIIDEHKEG